jgi:hypothetical protein
MTEVDVHEVLGDRPPMAMFPPAAMVANRPVEVQPPGNVAVVVQFVLAAQIVLVARGGSRQGVEASLLQSLVEVGGRMAMPPQLCPGGLQLGAAQPREPPSCVAMVFTAGVLAVVMLVRGPQLDGRAGNAVAEDAKLFDRLARRGDNA